MQIWLCILPGGIHPRVATDRSESLFKKEFAPCLPSLPPATFKALCHLWLGACWAYLPPSVHLSLLVLSTRTQIFPPTSTPHSHSKLTIFSFRILVNVLENCKTEKSSEKIMDRPFTEEEMTGHLNTSNNIHSHSCWDKHTRTNIKSWLTLHVGQGVGTRYCW